MKVGDLVELSAVGKDTVYCRRYRDKKGLVVKVRSKKNFMYPIIINWFGTAQMSHIRSHLKYVSRA